MSYGDYKLFLYDNVVELAVTTSGVYVDNRPMNNKRLVAHKGLTNNIVFSIRNKDRKLQNVYTDTLVAYLIDPATKRRVFKKILTTLGSLGEAELELNADDLQNVDPGRYTMYVSKTALDGTDNPVFTDQNNNISFDIIVTDQIDQTPVPTQEDTSLTQVASTGSGDPANVFTTSALFGNTDRNSAGLHTVGFYTTGYTGNITIQGSCVGSVPGASDTSTDWFTISTTSLANVSSITTSTFTMNANWIRVLHTPDSGSLDKVVLRN